MAKVSGNSPRVEEYPRAVQDRLDHLISSGPAVIYALSVKGETVEPNTVGASIARVTGYSVKEALRAEWWQEHTHPEELLRALATESVLQPGEPYVRQYQLTRSDGRTIWLRDESHVFLGSREAPLEIIGSLLDITEQKALEAQFLHAQKMDAFSRLAGGIAHDYNNLLCVISGYAQFELVNPELEPDARLALETILKAAASATELTRQLAGFSRRKTPDSHVVDLGVVLENLLSMFRRVIGAEITLSTHVPAGLPPIDMDGGMIEHILLNLTLNARDAMPAGGDLHIRIYPVALSQDDTRPGGDRRPGEFSCLEVRDTGRGMSQETLARIFEPFFTTKDAAKGLGLSTVHRIVQQHNGWVEAESELGRGSAFRVFLPTASWNDKEAEEAFDLSPRRAGDSTILLVEDDALLRSFLAMFLLKRGYRVLTADCAATAEAILAQPDSRVDLLMTDVVLRGGGSGRDLTTKARQVRPALRVLFTSGYHDIESGPSLRLEEGLNFLRKPFDLNRLAATIENCLMRQPNTAPAAT